MIFLSLILIFLFLLPLQSFSQDFPNKPITTLHRLRAWSGGGHHRPGFSRGSGTDFRSARGCGKQSRRVIVGSRLYFSHQEARRVHPSSHRFSGAGYRTYNEHLAYDPEKDFTYIIA